MEVDDAADDMAERMCVEKCKAETAARKNVRRSSRIANASVKGEQKLSAKEISDANVDKTRFKRLLKARVKALLEARPDIDIATLTTVLAEIGEHDASAEWLKVLERQEQEAEEQSLEDPILAEHLKQVIKTSIKVGEGLDNNLVREAIKLLSVIEPSYVPPQDPNYAMREGGRRKSRRGNKGRRRKTKRRS